MHFRNRGTVLALFVVGFFATVAMLTQAAVLFWAHHEFSPVESMIALQSELMQQGRGLYHNFESYPYIVTPYGPVFYMLALGLHALTIPWLQSERLISLAALGANWCIVWRILRLLVNDRRARVAGFLLVLASTNLCYWGTIGQTDMLAICFSLAAFRSFLDWRNSGATGRLVAAGIFVALAVFTKQTAVAAGATIAVCLTGSDRSEGSYGLST